MMRLLIFRIRCALNHLMQLIDPYSTLMIPKNATLTETIDYRPICDLHDFLNRR